MSYGIYLKDPVTGKITDVPGHLMWDRTYQADYHLESGIFTPLLNTGACLNITYNYGHYYFEIEFEVSEGNTSDYWLKKVANAIKPLY